MTKYNQETERLMLLYYSKLQERERRHYAFLEAQKLGHGGKRYVEKLFKISQKTIRKGGKELSNETIYNLLISGKQRQAGGGRKKFCR